MLYKEDIFKGNIAYRPLKVANSIIISETVTGFQIHSLSLPDFDHCPHVSYLVLPAFDVAAPETCFLWSMLSNNKAESSNSHHSSFIA